MSSYTCLDSLCGRKFQDESTFIEHVRRRHPNLLENLNNTLSKTVMQNDRKKEEDISKLPRLRLRPQSIDKGKEQPLKVNPTKKIMTPAEIVSNSRQEVQNMEEAKPKRSSLKTQQRLLSGSSFKEETQSQQLSSATTDLPKTDLRRQLLKKKDSIDLKAPEERVPTATTNDHVSLRRSRSKQQDPNSKLVTSSSSKLLVKADPITGDKPVLRISRSKEKHMSSTTTEKFFVRKASRSKLLQAEPTKRVVTPPTEQLFDLKSVPESSTVILRKPIGSFYPPFFCIQYLSLNHCNLSSICLDNLELLQQLSATHNNLISMSFLQYNGNDNLQTVHLENNLIQELSLPTNITVLTLSFNKIGDLEQLCQQISRNSSIVQLDLSCNPVKKLFNYRYELILKTKTLKKLDGMNLTKHDVDLALQYRSMTKQSKEPTKGTTRYYDRFHKKIEQDYSYAIAEKITEEQYRKMKKQYDQYDVKTEQLRNNMDIIVTENGILQQEIDNIRLPNSEQYNDEEYRLLQLELEQLEMMNFLQYASEEQLNEMVQQAKRKLE